MDQKDFVKAVELRGRFVGVVFCDVCQFAEFDFPVIA